MARVRPLRLERVDVAPLVHDAVSMVSIMARSKQITVRFGRCDVRALTADPIKLKRMLWNLLANALQVPLRAVKIHPLPFNTIPPKRQVSIKLSLAWQAYETPAVIAAFSPEKQNTSDATGNRCSFSNPGRSCSSPFAVL